MTERIKLENPGDELTLTVASVSPEDIGGYAYWKIADGAKEFVIPQKSLDAQLDRVGALAPGDMIGRTIKFSRSIKLSQHKKPYWNIDLVGNGEPVRTNPPKPSPRVSSNVPESALPEYLRDVPATETAELHAKVAGLDTEKIQKGLALYTALTEFVLRDIVPVYTKADVGVTDQSVAAMVATLYIQGSK